MLPIGSLLAASAFLVWFAPRLLTMGSWQVRMPRLALALWHTAFLLGVASAACAIVLAVGAAITQTRDTPLLGTVITVVAWGALFCIGGVAMVVASGTDTVADASRRNKGALLALPHVAIALDARTELRICNSPDALACSIPARRNVVVISTGLADDLTPAQLRAVIAHERAHLGGHHHLALRLADVNSLCLPRGAAAGRLRRVTGLLIELIADDHAARTAGAVHVANALLRTGTHLNDESMTLRATRLTRRTWRPASRLTPPSEIYRALAGDMRLHPGR